MITENKFKESLKKYSEYYHEEQKKMAEREAEKQKIDAKYESRLTELQRNKDKEENTVKQYCLENPAMFEKKKSIRTQFGDFGFRTSPAKVTILEGYTKPAVIEALKKLNSKCIKLMMTEDIDKTFVKKLPKEELAACGIEVIQEEKFFINADENVI